MNSSVDCCRFLYMKQHMPDACAVDQYKISLILKTCLYDV